MKFNRFMEGSLITKIVFEQQNFGKTMNIPVAYLQYSRKLLREKTFTNFIVLESPTKIFSTKSGSAVPTYDMF